MEHMYTKTKFIVYLKLKFKWVFYILFGDPVSQSPTKLPRISGSPQFVRRLPA